MKKLVKFIYKKFLKPILFTQDPDDVHDGALRFGNFWGKFRVLRWVTRKTLSFQDPSLEQEILGINFRNPVGLAAGFDKNGDMVKILPHLGFGFASIGSITWKPYEGNPRPWSYRLPEIKSLLINYGLKNIGAEKILDKVENNREEGFVVGISVAKTNSKETADLQKGIEDYFNTIKILNEREVGDFVEINISCPNTFGGEPFTDTESLAKLLDKIGELKIEKPIFLKMPINLSWADFQELLDIAVIKGVSGIVIGNCSKDRETLKEIGKIPDNIAGSLSGKPTEELSNKLISKTYEKYGDKFVIIGVGGIFSANDAYEKIKRGASLVQLITGMIYEGPQLIGEINQGLVRLLHEDGYKKIEEAVGAYFK